MGKPVAKRASMPAFVEPCLATLAAEPPDGAQWAHEIKFDGYRLQARIENGEIQLLTRSGLDWTERFGGLANSLLTLKVKSAIVDGEVIVEDEHGVSSFAELVADLKARRSGRMVFFAFDLLYLDDADTRALPLADRKALLKRLLPRRKNSQVRMSDHVQGTGAAMFAEACKLGLEGIISKRLDKPYRSGRGVDWLKAKCIQTNEFVIVGYLDSTAITGAVGALVVGYYEGKQLIYAGRVGTGFNLRVAGDLWQRLQKLRMDTSAIATRVNALQARGVVWVKPSLVAQVEHRDWTGDGLLRHASFKSLRADKPPTQVNNPR
jgi:bifunctional non-homologous end joining protein LigD